MALPMAIPVYTTPLYSTLCYTILYCIPYYIVYGVSQCMVAGQQFAIFTGGGGGSGPGKPWPMHAIVYSRVHSVVWYGML